MSKRKVINVESGVLKLCLQDSKVHSVLPCQLVPQVLKLLHNEMEHLCRDRVLTNIQDSFFWVGRHRDVEEWFDKCRRFVCAKAPQWPHKVPLGK